MTDKFPSIKETVLSKTYVFLPSKVEFDDSFSDSQFFAEGFKIYCKDRIKNGGGLLLYVNENLPIKIINTYKFKKKSEIILFAFNVSKKN